MKLVIREDRGFISCSTRILATILLVTVVDTLVSATAAFTVLSSPRRCYDGCNLAFAERRPCVFRGSSSDDNPTQSSTARPSKSRDIHSLQDWATERGVRFHNHVGLVSSSSLSSDDDSKDEGNDDWGVSLLTTSTNAPTTIKAGTIVLSVPNSLVLSSTRVADELVDAYNLNLHGCMNILEERGVANRRPEFLLTVKILLEVTKREESVWQPWLASLPTTFPTGVYMNSFEKSCLLPFAFAVAEYATETVQAFHQALACLLDQPAADSLSSMKEAIEEQRYEEDDVVKWAYSIVLSRCWKYADQVEDPMNTDKDEIVRTDIVPLGDMFNHADPANVVVHYVNDSDEHTAIEEKNSDDDSTNAVKFVLTQDIELDQVSTRPEQLCLSYGLSTNPYRFLILFGFVNENMQNIFCQVLFTNPSKEMADLGCNDRSKMVYRTEDGGIANAVWDTVLYALLEQQTGNSEAEAARKTLYQAHIDGDDKTKAEIRQKYLLESCLTLRNHVVKTLNEINSLVDKVDNIMEASGDASMVEKEYPRLSMIHRHNLYVQSVFQKVKDRLDDMTQKEMTRRRQLTAES